MKTTKTYEEIQTFLLVSRNWLVQDKANSQTKLGYAIQRVTTRLEKIWQRYQNAVEDISIDNCSTDEKGIILRNERNQYQYTKEGLKKRNAEIQKLFESQVEFESYFATDLPTDLSESERIAFEGFVIQEEAMSATGD